MKAAKLILVLIVILALMGWSRGVNTFSLPMTLPLLGGERMGIYDAAGVVVIGITLWGLMRLRRRRRDEYHDEQER